MRVCACFRVRAHRLKAAPEQRAGGWVSEGPTWRRLTWRFAAVSALRSRSISVSLSLSHTHTDMHAPHSTAPRPELVFQSPHTQRTAISPDKAPLCSLLHELIPPALWPQPGLLTRETDRERELERGGGGTERETHTQTHTFTTTHARTHTDTHVHHHTCTHTHRHTRSPSHLHAHTQTRSPPPPHTHTRAHTHILQHREKVRGSREWKERQGQTHGIRDPQRERRGRHRD